MLGLVSAYAMLGGSELGRYIATSAQWAHENVITAEIAGIILGNTLVAGVSDTLFPEITTFAKVTSVGLSLICSSLGGYASAREHLGEGRTLSEAAIRASAKWAVASLVAGGTMATVGTITLHAAAGPLLGGATCFLINKYVTLREAQKDLLLQRA